MPLLVRSPRRSSPRGLSCFGRHTLNTPPASQPQHPQSAPRPYPLERHPPPPRWSLHLTSRGGRDRKVSTTSRRLAGEIHDDASSSGGRPSGPRVRPDAPVARIAASSGKRSHDPARRSRVDTAGRLPNAPTTAKFRSCRAPADTSGCNGLLPAPLRFVHHGKRRAMPVPQRVGIRRLGDNFLPKS